MWKNISETKDGKMIRSVEEVRGSDRGRHERESRERGTMRFLAAELRGEKEISKLKNTWGNQAGNTRIE